MTPYLFAYGFLFLCLFAGVITHRIRTGVVLGSVPMVLLILLRGVVGVDTAFYMILISIIHGRGIFAVSIEPGFSVAVNLLMYMVHDPLLVVVILGTTTAVLMLVAGLLLERTPLFLAAVVLPYFYFDMTMNGLRYGLAFALITLATAFLLRGRRAVFAGVAGLAAMFQITSLVLAAGIWALLESRIRTFILIAVFMTAALLYFDSYLIDKASANASLTAVSATSGLVPLALSLMLLGVLFLLPELRISSMPALTILTLAAIGSFVLSRYFYAGLRVQQLFLFMIYIYGAARVSRLGINLVRRRDALIVLMVVGVLASGFRLKNFYDERGYGASPFAPYYFSWER